MGMPVTVIAGLAGPAKSALIAHWRTQALSPAALIIDRGEDFKFPREQAGSAGEDPAIERIGGCVCCSASMALGGALRKLQRRGEWAHLLVDLNGGAHPAAFIDALRLDDALYTYALDKNIVLAAPSTLLATCRTVAHLQKLDKRSSNAMKIADQAGKLYDQFVAFSSDMIKVSKALVAANEAQDSALKRLSSGKGNLVRQTEQLKALGAKTTKSVPFGLIEDDLPALPDVPVPDPE